MRGAMKNFVLRDDAADLVEVVAAGAEITLIGGEIAAGGFDAQAMTFLQTDGRDHLIQGHFIHAGGLHQGGLMDAVTITHALGGIIQVERPAVGKYVDQLQHDVGVGGGRTDEQPRLDVSRESHVAREGIAGVDQDVLAAFDAHR